MRLGITRVLAMNACLSNRFYSDCRNFVVVILIKCTLRLKLCSGMLVLHKPTPGSPSSSNILPPGEYVTFSTRQHFV